MQSKPKKLYLCNVGSAWETFTGWHTAFPDALYRIDLTTERRLRDENDLPFFLVEFIGDEAGHPFVRGAGLSTC